MLRWQGMLPDSDEAEAEEYLLEHAGVVLTAYGVSGRVYKPAMNLLRAQGAKASMVRAVTVHPLPLRRL